MKNDQLLLILFFVLMSNAFAKAQQEKPVAKLVPVARYTDSTGMELRLFPDRRKMLELGFKQGWSLQRSESGSGTFTQIAEVKPYSEGQWQQAIDNASDEEARETIVIAYDFYKGILTGTGGSFDMSEGIAALREQRAKEDFEFLVFLLQAIKEPEAARGLGLAFEDKTAVAGTEYTYKFRLNGESPVYAILSEEYTTVARENKELYKRKVYTKVGDTKLSFIWEEDELLAGVDVERVVPRTNTSTQLNEAPIYGLRGKNSSGPPRASFDEDSLVNYTKYRYRFYGYTPFGERVKFAEVEAIPRDLTAPQKPFLKQPVHAKPDEVHVSWEMNAPVAEDFKGFAVSRGDKNKGRFALLHDKLLPANARTFIDKSFVKGKTNYYLVQALDTANNVSSSFPVAVTLIDSVSPVKPIFMDGKMDSLGIVTIVIKPNKEKDLMGYRLYRSNQDDHEFSQIEDVFISGDKPEVRPSSTIKDTVTTRSLTPYVYYRVEALDFNHNTSPVSEILKVKRPDKIAPTTPVFTGVKVREQYVDLAFALSRSKDVEVQKLYRKTELSSEWLEVAILKPGQKSYRDEQVKQGTKYYYSLRAQDDSGNLSEFAVPVMGKPYDNGKRPGVQNLRIQKDKETMILAWDYKEMNENTFFVIYKTNVSGNLIQYDNCLELRFSESARNGDTYAVKVFTKDGGQSMISEKVIFKE